MDHIICLQRGQLHSQFPFASFCYDASFPALSEAFIAVQHLLTIMTVL